jgi:hypothetical protein
MRSTDHPVSRPRRHPFALVSLTLALGLSALGYPTVAGAGDLFEIQVYEAEVNDPGQFALEVHTNYTVRGRTLPEYAGEQSPHHVGRLTLEPALGITEYLELGAYLQNMVNADGHYDFAGWKLRTKWVVPGRYTGKFFFGMNVEIGKVPRKVEAEGWANEFRPIAGYYDGTWLIDVNPIIGYALSGPDKLRPDIEPAGKVAWNTQKGFMVGTEYYAGLGYLTDLSPIKRQEHLMFLTVDCANPKGHAGPESPWALNVGVGYGLTEATPQRWIVKAIVGRSF